MMADLIDMEVFSRVVSNGSMSGAARELNLSPAVVSKRIQKLEDRLGVRLLQRTTRQIALTEAGSGYYDRVVAILARIEEAEDFVTGGNSNVRGTLKLSAPTSFGRMHVAPHLKAFQDLHPDLRIHIQLSDDFIDIVGESYDLAIRIAELEDSSLVARRLAPNRRVICAAPGYLREFGVPRAIDDLQNHRCLAATNQEIWRLEGPDGPTQLRVSSNVQTNSSEVIREAVIGGMGIALRSTWDVGDALRSGDLRIILPKYSASRHVAVYAVYPTRRFLPAKVRALIDYLSAIYGPEPYWDHGVLEKTG